MVTEIDNIVKILNSGIMLALIWKTCRLVADLEKQYLKQLCCIIFYAINFCNTFLIL